MSNIITILCAQAILAYNQVLTKESSSCYGTNIACDFYSLECRETELIRLNALYYGYKRGKDCYKSEEACKQDGGCCRYQKSDCTNKLHEETIFDIYTNCSGKSTCGPFQAPWVGMSYCGPMSEVITSDYLNINYECIDKIENLDICDTQNLLTDHVYLIFDGFKNNGANVSPEGACSCSFTGVGIENITSIAVTIIDVRLAKFNTRQSDCTSARLKIQNKTFERKCSFGSTISNFYNNLNLEYILPNDKVDISLEGMYSNDISDHPALIWLQVKGNNSFHLSCNNYQSNNEQRTNLPDILDDVSEAGDMFTPSPDFIEPDNSTNISTNHSKLKDDLYQDSFDKSASHLQIREAAGKHVDEPRNGSGDVMVTESSTSLHPKSKFENKRSGHTVTTDDTAEVKENLGTNDSTLHQKDTQGLDNNSDNSQIVVNIVIPVLTGVLMTFVVIISVYVKCRTRKRNGRYKTNASEGTYLDEESETETPNGALSSSSKPEALCDNDIESTKL
ncbi:hypothetical protein ACJMK2_029551 [Sinanodonta woodiana]|uniref:Uncharacterized protein n=1 Tax=Sinanodonta woodiana TaxID=1069815 RepID=A0ABD3XE54_SINWO